MKINDAKISVTSYFAAVAKRQELIASADNLKVMKFITKNDAGIAAGMVKIKKELIDFIIAAQENEQKASDGFIGVKVNEKIVKTLFAIGTKSLRHLDGYTATIVSAALHNDGVCFSKTALVALCDDVVYNEQDQSQVVRNRMRCALGTANTQKSSTRMILRALNLAVIDKRKKDDIITLTENGKVVFSALFDAIIPAKDNAEVETV